MALDTLHPSKVPTIGITSVSGLQTELTGLQTELDGQQLELDAQQLELDDKIDVDIDSVITSQIVVADNARNGGMVGTYVSTKTQQIWAMGMSYLSAADGTDFGSLYGLAYKHTNNATGGTMAGGHQVVWATGGTARCALGTDIWTSGNLIAYSDIRVKENLQQVENALSRLIQLNGYTYDRIDTGEHQLGVVAQEVMAVFPELVRGDTDAYSVAYGNFAGVFIEAFKEVNDRLEKQTKEISDLKRALQAVEDRLARLEAAA